MGAYGHAQEATGQPKAFQEAAQEAVRNFPAMPGPVIPGLAHKSETGQAAPPPHAAAAAVAEEEEEDHEKEHEKDRAPWEQASKKASKIEI